jgi:hypothetical protein
MPFSPSTAASELKGAGCKCLAIASEVRASVDMRFSCIGVVYVTVVD